MVNRIRSERKVKRKFGASTFECFEGPSGDVLRTSRKRHELTSQRRLLNFRLARPLDVASSIRLIGMSPGSCNRIFRGRSGDVGRWRPRDVLGGNIFRPGNFCFVYNHFDVGLKGGRVNLDMLPASSEYKAVTYMCQCFLISEFTSHNKAATEALRTTCIIMTPLRQSLELT